MPSTSESNVLVSANRLSLSFQYSANSSPTLRDAFVRTLTHPLETMMSSRRSREILKGLSFQIKAGERVALIGRNGVGKSTLCRVLAGFLRPTRGSYAVNGKVRAVLDSSIGLYPELSGRENAHILLSLMNPDMASIDDVLEECLEFSELGESLDKPLRAYSTGMQTRLALSIVSALPSELLILDEVFDGADRFWREKVAARVMGLIQKSGAVLFVSHQEDQIRRVCTRALYLKDGVLVFDGGVEDALTMYHASDDASPA